MNDDMHDKLEAWGSDPTPAPDAEFAGRLEADLRSAAYFAPKTTDAVAPGRRLLRPGIVLAAVVLLAGVAVSALTNVGDDNTIVPAATPVELTPTSTPQTPTPATQPSPTPDALDFQLAPFDFGASPDDELPDEPPDEPPAASEPRQASPDNAEPTPTRPTPAPTADPPEAAALPTPAAAPPVTDITPEPTPAVAEPTPADTDVTPTLTLERSYRANRARLSWAITDDGTTQRWQVRVRRGDTVRTTAVLPRRRNELTVDRPERDRVFYRVVAIGSDGAVVAESNEVRVASRVSSR